MAAKPVAAAAVAEELVSVVWCTTLGIPEDVANKLVDARWRVAGLTKDESKFEKVLAGVGCLAGDIDAAWRKWQAASSPSPAQPSGIKHQADDYAATHRKIPAQQAVVFRQEFTRQQTHEWFAQCYKMDDAPYSISEWDVDSWPSGQEVVQGDANHAYQFLHYLLKASGAKLRKGPEPPVWVGALTETLREQGRIVAAILLGNFIYCDDLAGGQVIATAGQLELPIIFAAWKKPNMATSSDSRLNSAMCLLEAQCKNSNNNTLQDLSEFDITIRFLAHIFDEPIGLCGVKQLNEYANELNVPVTFEWRRTKLEATAGQIPDAYLYMALRETRREKKFPLLYIEDKRTSAPSGLVANDVIKILALARNSHDGICKAFQLSEKGACFLIIPAVVTKWPEITLYGVCRQPDNTYAAKELKKVNFTAHIGVAPSELTVGSDAAKEREYERLFGFHVLALVKNACKIIADHRNSKAKLVYLPAYKWANSEWQEISKSSKPFTVPATTASSPKPITTQVTP